MEDGFTQDHGRMEHGNRNAGLENSSDILDILQLFGKDRLEEIQRLLAKVTGIAFVTVDYRGNPLTEMTHFTPFCQYIRQDQAMRQNCHASDAFGAIQSAVQQKPLVYFCPCGMIELAIPIVIRGHYLGGFIGGQFRCDDAPGGVPRLAKITIINDTSEEKIMRAKLQEKVEITQYRKIVAAANLVSLIINQLTVSEVSQQADRQADRQRLDKLEAELKCKDAELAVKNSRIDELNVELDPHFMMDVLSSICNIATVENAVQIGKMAETFSEYIKYRFMQQGKAVQLCDELKSIEKYLFLEKEKYRDSLSYAITMDETMGKEKIPANMLQPFVANAVFSGAVRREGGGRIEITILRQDKNNVIKIEDNGPCKAYEPEWDDDGGRYIGMGIRVATERLKKMFGHNCDIYTENLPKEGRLCVIRWSEMFSEREG